MDLVANGDRTTGSDNRTENSADPVIGTTAKVPQGDLNRTLCGDNPMANLTLTDTETEVFAIGVQEAYQHADYFDTGWSIFQGQVAGESLNVPVVQAGEAENKADGTSHDNGATIESVNIDLVDPVKSFSDILKTQVDIRPDLNLISNVGAQLGRDVGFGRSLRIANHLSFTADANSKSVTDDFVTVSGLGDTVKNAIATVMGNMDDDGVPTSMRFGLLKPKQFYSMRGVAEVVSVDFTRGQNVNQSIGGNMAGMEYLNCLIRNMGGIFGVDWTASAHSGKNLPTASGLEMADDMTNIVGIFWHHEAFGVRHQTGLESSIDWIQRNQVWMSIARLHMGIKVIQIEGLWILVHSS